MPGDPTPAQRLRYAFGGRLPADQRDWVRHDLMDAGWRWRALGRQLVQVLPVLVVAALLPASAIVKVLLGALVLLSSLFTAAAYADQLRDRRLRQHGLPVPEQEPPPTWQGGSAGRR